MELRVKESKEHRSIELHLPPMGLQSIPKADALGEAAGSAGSCPSDKKEDVKGKPK